MYNLISYNLTINILNVRQQVIILCPKFLNPKINVKNIYKYQINCKVVNRLCTLNFNNYRVVLGFHLGHIISLLHYYLYMFNVTTNCKLNEIGYDIQPLVFFLLCLFYYIVVRRYHIKRRY